MIVQTMFCDSCGSKMTVGFETTMNVSKANYINATFHLCSGCNSSLVAQLAELRRQFSAKRVQCQGK